MIKHVVIWKLKDTEDKKEKALLIKEKLEELKDKISEIKMIEVGINFNECDGVADIILITEFDTKADLDSYQKNPLHQGVASEYVRPNVCERRLVDYEF